MKQIRHDEADEVAGGLDPLQVGDLSTDFPHFNHGPGEGRATGLEREFIDTVQDASSETPLPGVK